MAVQVKFVCPICKVHHHKDYGCTGDYYNTTCGIVLQSYCPLCGRMEPLISGKRYSHKEMRKHAIRIAMAFGLDFKRCKSLAKDSDGVDFIFLFSKEFNLPSEKVSGIINNGHDRK